MALGIVRLGLRVLAVAVFAAAFADARMGAQEIEVFNVPAYQGITLGPDGAMWLPIGDGSIGRGTTEGNVTDLFCGARRRGRLPATDDPLSENLAQDSLRFELVPQEMTPGQT